MNRFDDKAKEKKISIAGRIVVIAIIIGLFIVGSNYFLNSQYLDSESRISDAIYRDMIHCYSIEGYYPPSVEYMEEHFGLIYDKEKYYIEYSIIGDSIMPTFEITERTQM